MTTTTLKLRQQNRTRKRREYVRKKMDSIFAYEHDEYDEEEKASCKKKAPTAPFILPDSLIDRTRSKIKRVKLTKKLYQAAKTKSKRSFGQNKRCYVSGRLYRETEQGEVYTVDCSKLDGSGIVISVSTNNKDGLIGEPTHKKKNQYQIRAGRVSNNVLLSRIVLLGNALNQRMPKGNARLGARNAGVMHVFGDRVYRGERVTYKSMSERKSENAKSLHLLEEIQRLVLITTLALSKWMRQGSNTCWRCLLERLRKSEREKNIFPSDGMGGRGGVTSSGVISTDLGNEAHYDVLDDGESVSVWAEVIPGTANNWYLCFPNMEICTQGKTYYGLRIKLCHGAIVNWDGRVMKHFTSITKVGERNHVYGFFFCPSTRLLPT